MKLNYTLKALFSTALILSSIACSNDDSNTSVVNTNIAKKWTINQLSLIRGIKKASLVPVDENNNISKRVEVEVIGENGEITTETQFQPLVDDETPEILGTGSFDYLVAIIPGTYTLDLTPTSTTTTIASEEITTDSGITIDGEITIEGDATIENGELVINENNIEQLNSNTVIEEGTFRIDDIIIFNNGSLEGINLRAGDLITTKIDNRELSTLFIPSSLFTPDLSPEQIQDLKTNTWSIEGDNLVIKTSTDTVRAQILFSDEETLRLKISAENFNSFFGNNILEGLLSADSTGNKIQDSQYGIVGDTDDISEFGEIIVRFDAVPIPASIE